MAYSYGSIDEMGDGVFRKVRRELGVTAFGVNALVLAPGTVSRPHFHEEQDELYFVHSGRAVFDFPDDRMEVGPGGLVHVEAETPRRVTNPGPDRLDDRVPVQRPARDCREEQEVEMAFQYLGTQSIVTLA